MAIDPSSRPSVLLPSTPWDPQTRSTSGPNAVPAPAPAINAAPARVDGGLPGAGVVSDAGGWGLLNPANWSWSPGGSTSPSGTANPSPGFRRIEPKPQNPSWQIRDIPKWNAPDELKEVLGAAGYDYGTAAPAEPEPLSLVDMANAQQLTEHSYQISDRDWSAIQRLNGQWVDPVKNPAPEVRTGYDQAAPMTQQAYDALSEDQKRAVQFNTLLMDAREQDLNAKTQLSGAQLEQYNADVESIFGEGGGSGVVAPTTVKMLKSLQLDLKGQDLDDFLSGEAGVQLNELLDFKGAQVPMAMGPSGGTGPNQDLVDFTYSRSAENRALVTSTAIAKAGHLIEQALKNQQIARPDWLGTVQQQMGYSVDPNALPVGWGVPEARTDTQAKEMEALYNGVYTWLADANTQNLDRLWQEVGARKFSEKDIDDLFSYIDQRTKWELRVGGTGGRAGARTAAEIRTLAGLDGGTNG